MKKLVLLTVLGIVMSSSAFAAKRYGSAGCGLGSIVMGKDGSQVLAGTTNGTSGSQTFGITSGTSNCVDDGTVQVSMAVPMFVEVNRVSLASDIARGGGETVASLSSILGCKDSAKLGAALQKNYNSIFPTETVENEAVTESIHNIVDGDSALSQNCSAQI